MQGHRIGGAGFSEQHANFIVNLAVRVPMTFMH